MTRVKICGITRLEDALHAIACGADMLGFNFYSKSPRYVRPEAAREITASLPSNVEAIGVFVNEANPAIVRQIANIAGIRSVQLHGDESLEFCTALSDLNVIKAFRVGKNFNVAEIAKFSDYRILLDASTPDFGGSGSKCDWNIARQVREMVSAIFLAGGLDADSVGEAIRTVDPGAVDACSLLEIAPGIKDPQKVESFIAAVNRENLAAAEQRFLRGIQK